MPFTKDELKYFKNVLGKEIKHLKKDEKGVIFPESLRFQKAELLLERFQKDLLKKINKMLR